eukprot:SAG11_NODE_9978_length_865_cov_0.737598_1_plen_76_part_01
MGAGAAKLLSRGRTLIGVLGLKLGFRTNIYVSHRFVQPRLIGRDSLFSTLCWTLASRIKATSQPPQPSPLRTADAL